MYIYIYIYIMYIYTCIFYYILYIFTYCIISYIVLYYIIFIYIYIYFIYMHYIKYYLNRSISFARSITTISDSLINIIHLSRKSFLFYKISAWLKKGNNSLSELLLGVLFGL